MYERGITILPREDSVMGKGLKKLIKGPCPLEDMATAWELNEPSALKLRFTHKLLTLQNSEQK